MPKIRGPDFDPDASSDQISSYELKRLQTIEANRKMLQQLSIPSLITSIKPPVVKKEEAPKAPKRDNNLKSKPYLTRAQAKEKGLYIADSFTVEKERIMTRTAKRRMEEEERMKNIVDEDGEELAVKSRFPQHPKVNYFGHIPNIPVGTIFKTRMECSYAGVHRPTVAGIYGTHDKGCYSICFSGGYDDDIDQGEYILFSGSGGRDLKGTSTNPKNLRTAPQTFDQEWTGNNLMLKIAAENKRPIRVVRGYKGRAPYAPEEGYRYDGLYVIEQYTRKKGKSGFLICQFKMKRLADQPPLKY